MLGCPTGNALIVKGMRCDTHRVSSAVSSPWSWAARSPIPFTMSTTRDFASLRNTPTVMISGGTRSMMRRTAWGATWRGEGANMNPTASAPRPTARSASGSDVIPQIFTSTGSPLARPGLVRRGLVHAGAGADPVPRERPQCGPSIGGPHQRLPHQHGLVAGRRQGTDVVAVADARFGHGHDVGRDELHQTGGAVGVHRERREVALVDAHELRPGVEGPVELALVVHLDQGIEGELARQAEKARELVFGQRRHDEQDGVGPHEPG